MMITLTALPGEKVPETANPARPSLTPSDSCVSLASSTEPSNEEASCPNPSKPHAAMIKSDPGRTPQRPPVKAEMRSPPATAELQDAQTPFHENRAHTADFHQRPAEEQEAPKTAETQKNADEAKHTADLQQRPAQDQEAAKTPETQKKADAKDTTDLQQRPAEDQEAAKTPKTQKKADEAKDTADLQQHPAEDQEAAKTPKTQKKADEANHDGSADKDCYLITY